MPTLAEEGGTATGPGTAGFGLKVDIHVEGVEDDGIIRAAHYVSTLFALFHTHSREKGARGGSTS